MKIAERTLPSKKRSIGICLGASTISAVLIEMPQKENHTGIHTENGRPQMIDCETQTHSGDPEKTLFRVLEKFNLNDIDHIAVTGRRFHKSVNLSSIPESQAVEFAYKFLKPPDIDSPAIVSAGGETFMAYALNKKGEISNVLTGNKCASGTGEFFLQQLKRMNISVHELGAFTGSTSPYHVSGRCSVFCKSDCTHATNKGVPKKDVTYGLCIMMANKILELLKKVNLKNIMITGGTTLNPIMVNILKKNIPGLIIPDEAPYFEASGAALWALHNRSRPFPGFSRLIHSDRKSSFGTHPPLRDYKHLVTFKTLCEGLIKPGDTCILGLDVGSTTTKAVLLRDTDQAILASIYLRTNGDPVGASRDCYRSIRAQIAQTTDPSSIRISGLGVCGSGRQIAGLHAMTDGIINEIIAHATAAVFFDPHVDTIFEIGGQDAKYTYITNGVPSDYAMNEACSAGTGSFLEESAYETLNIPMQDITEIALKADNPPNFNDQCAAFISSDIKTAIHEGIHPKDIVAGLVYSICMNYSNRVKGNRMVGKKIFMQGGVCYNKAVPLAMAGLIGRPIVVPPEPGLMGAFGVALAVRERIQKGIIQEKSFHLNVLADRTVTYKKPFTCKGGKEKCDRKCTISAIQLDGKIYPFGGACNRYYNLHHDIHHDMSKLDLVKTRQTIIFKEISNNTSERDKKKPSIGINRSFLVNTYYPLYATFFSELGINPVMPELPSQKGIDMKDAAFCFPAELAHGFFHTLITMKAPPEYIFLPHFKAVPNKSDEVGSQVCPFVQGETFYLRQTFKKELHQLEKKGARLLTPLIDLSEGIAAARTPLITTAIQMGLDQTKAEQAFDIALSRQTACSKEMMERGRKTIAELEKNKNAVGIVVFSRSYNGFAEEAHMGIPNKFASRGVFVIPFDFLLFATSTSKRHMYWGMGQRILMAAKTVKNHPQLFGTYITNFSCGPDSFLIGYFRDIMGTKPSLTLELDSHTADAGIETRIEAFLDIVSAFRRIHSEKAECAPKATFTPAQLISNNGTLQIITSSKETLPLTHKKVKILIPSMGKLTSEAMAAVLRSAGFRTISHPPSNESILKLGQAHTSCKECLPLILTTGTLLNYIAREKKEDDVLVYFMPTASGPCRFGQYSVFIEDLIKRQKIQNVALLSPTAENGYAGIGSKILLRGWWGTIISDSMEDIRSMLLANAVDTQYAMNRFENEWEQILHALEIGIFSKIETQLKKSLKKIRAIPMKQSPRDVPAIFLAGEIFVRRDPLARRHITEYLAGNGFAVVCSPVIEWIKYTDYLVDQGLSIISSTSKIEKMKFKIKNRLMLYYEKRLKAVLEESGLIHAAPVDIKKIMDHGKPFISEELIGEAILTVGSSLAEVASMTCGVIAIGPFGCMPNRLSEAILNQVMNRQCKLDATPKNGNGKLKKILEDIDDLPFLAIESDGSPFPQLINTKLETLMIRAERLHRKMRDVKS
ncbi:MAG: activase [Proteobacteria bacterium]|nr:activase [Pseudomonadota bacterium]